MSLPESTVQGKEYQDCTLAKEHIWQFHWETMSLFFTDLYQLESGIIGSIDNQKCVFHFIMSSHSYQFHSSKVISYVLGKRELGGKEWKIIFELFLFSPLFGSFWWEERDGFVRKGNSSMMDYPTNVMLKIPHNCGKNNGIQYGAYKMVI